MRVRNARLRNLLRNGEEGVKTLGDGPGETLFLRFVLYVPGGHVDCEEVACQIINFLSHHYKPFFVKN